MCPRNYLIVGVAVLVLMGASMQGCNHLKDRLVECILSGDKDCVKDCIKKGVDLDFIEKRTGATPIMLAIQMQEREIVDLLIKSGADITMKSEEGRSCIYYACDAGSLPILKELIANGLDPSVADLQRDTVIAAYKGHLEILKYLQQVGVPFDRSFGKGKYGPTQNYLLDACYGGHNDVITWLLDLGLSVETRGIAGILPLHIAAKTGNLQLAEILLEKGASPNGKDDLGDTPLHVAAGQDNSRIVGLLLSHGADPDKQDGLGMTALIVACFKEAGIQTIQELVQDGADIHIKDSAGHSAFYYAEKYGHEDVVSLLSTCR